MGFSSTCWMLFWMFHESFRIPPFKMRGRCETCGQTIFFAVLSQDDRILTCCVIFLCFLAVACCCHHSWELQRWQLSHDVSLLASGDNDGLDLETQRRNKIRTSVREALMLHVLRSMLVVLVTSSCVTILVGGTRNLLYRQHGCIDPSMSCALFL